MSSITNNIIIFLIVMFSITIAVIASFGIIKLSDMLLDNRK